MSRPAVSQHLRILEGVGLVTGRADGRRRVYRLSAGGLAELRAYVEDLWDGALAAFADEAEHDEGAAP